MRTPYFLASGGDLLTRDGARLTLTDAAALLDLYLDEMIAAAGAADTAALTQARQAAEALCGAINACRRWLRAGGGWRSTAGST